MKTLTRTRLVPAHNDADGLSVSRSHSRMEDRWRLRSQIAKMGDVRAAWSGSWDHVPFARTAGCGRMLCAESAEIRRKDGRHYVAGVSTCGSVWLCPVCEAKIRTRRAVEVRELGTQHVGAGGSIGLLTLTVRHAPADSLGDIVAAQLDAWKSIQQDKRFRRLHRTWTMIKPGPRGGTHKWITHGDEPLVGTIRTMETTQGFTTQGQGGSWHPHQHIVMLWRDNEDHSEDVAWIADAWAERVERRLGRRPGAHGFDYRSIGADNVDYVSKIADEITRADLKGESRSVWALVEHAANGEVASLYKFLEYSVVMKGKRCLQFSHGLRALYGLGDDVEDEELATENVDGELVELLGKKELQELMSCGWGDYPRMVDYLIGLDCAHIAHNLRSVLPPPDPQLLVEVLQT